MEARGLLLLRAFSSLPLRLPCRRNPVSPPSSPLFKPFSSSSSSPRSASSQRTYRGPKPRRDLVREWVSRNDALVRSSPIFVGGVALLAVLLNRAFSGIAPVADASSSQSRADILTLALAVTDILTGLVWLSIRPKVVSPVVPQGVECERIKSAESLNKDGDAMIVDVHKLIEGSLYKSVMKSGKQSYLANLSLYPGRSELPFLPTNTQALILQPLGDTGIAIVGGDTIRGFTNFDQAWINLMAEKLDATLASTY
ncbi:protein COFACTOR ASSEMBLY OF COMPLEX C SUBUNIT B CCB4, chloroplastic isoform X3 [Ananas comosus]|uniref:Protein COFACTOR ASSEMBLY OF COMPLEX C SUBUNIT B CCB4, chloroplastic isoform X3 n=1 Tax=Ananas comosus TaxID=4615 RepID=A0A6P5EHE8_ANACO|nr:protein COFACTOR ASSEMBLY OF COMPLEX C SUBUNIT B CCB4, chloroplastic isoform X3 [Ananas comosus]